MRAERVRLADEQPFWLGRAQFDPPTRQMIVDGRSTTVEPRAMQVLVVLGQADGAVVSRDELVARCWDGRIVGDAAINRIISIIRRLASVAGNAFALETVTKVGYRLTAEGVDAPSPVLRIEGASAPLSSRRRLLVAGGAVALAGSVGVANWLWQTGHRDDLPPEARSLLIKAREVRFQANAEASMQELAYLERAAALAPRSPEILGALAIAYLGRMDYSSPQSYRNSAAWVQSAVRRAFAVDPNNADAAAALVVLKPDFRRWADFEYECRAVLAKHPDQPDLKLALGQCLENVGRWNEAVDIYKPMVIGNSDNQAAALYHALALWGAGRLQEADEAFASATRSWPSSPIIYNVRFSFAVVSGQARKALEFVSDDRDRPSGRMLMPFELGLQVARALESREQKAIAAAIRTVVAARAARKMAAQPATAYLAALGAAREAFDAMIGYIGGPVAPAWQPGKSHSWPLAVGTNLLFGNPLPVLRRDPRFTPLLVDLGLEDYWRSTGTKPDYRQ